MVSKKIAPELLGLAGPFTALARTMAANWDVEVIPSGMRCATDGKRIWIPFTADYLSDKDRAVLHGHLDHELSHVMEERTHLEAGRPTPLELMAMLKRSRTREGRIIMLLTNAFEDIRIEYKYSRRYPGMADNLAAANAHAVVRFRARTEKDKTKASFWGELACAIITTARGNPSEWIREDVTPYLELVAEEIVAAGGSAWASESLTLAQRTFEKVSAAAKESSEKAEKRKEEAAKAPPPPPPEETEEEEATEPSEGGESSADAGEAEPSEDVEPSEESAEDGSDDDDSIEADDSIEEDAEGGSEGSGESDETDDSSESSEDTAPDAGGEEGEESEGGAEGDSDDSHSDAADESDGDATFCDDESASGSEGAPESETSSDDASDVGDESGEEMLDGEASDGEADGKGSPGEERSAPGDGGTAGGGEGGSGGEVGPSEDVDEDYAQDDEDEPALADKPEEDGMEEFEGAAKEALADEAPVDDIFDVSKEDMEHTIREDAVTHERYVPNPASQRADAFVSPDWKRFAATELTSSKDELEVRGTIAERDAISAENLRKRSIQDYNSSFADISTQIGSLRGRQRSVLQTMTKRRVIGGMDAGQLDDGALAGVRLGDKYVFTDMSKKLSIDTAIEVLIDLSGSMGYSNNKVCCAYYAKRTVIALAESWESIRMPYEIMGFYNDNRRSDVGWSSSPPGIVSRAPFVYPIFKGWNERLSACRERFSAISGYYDNADGEAVMAAARRLAQRKERRRILVVVSDGAPCHTCVDSDVLEKHLRDSIKLITKAGLEVWGIGAGTDAPRRYYNETTGAKNIIIKDLKTLAPTLFVALRSRIQVAS